MMRRTLQVSHFSGAMGTQVGILTVGLGDA